MLYFDSKGPQKSLLEVFLKIINILLVIHNQYSDKIILGFILYK
jgi:hypothetical protein